MNAALTKKYNTHAALANDRMAIAAQVTEHIKTNAPRFGEICAEIRASERGLYLTAEMIGQAAAGRIYAGDRKATRLLGCSVRKLTDLLFAAQRADDSFLADAIKDKLDQVEAARRALWNARHSI